MDPKLVNLEDAVKPSILIVHSEGDSDENSQFLLDTKAALRGVTFNTVLTCSAIECAHRLLDIHCRRVGMVITSDFGWALKLHREHPWLRSVPYEGDDIPDLLRSLHKFLPIEGMPSQVG